MRCADNALAQFDERKYKKAPQGALLFSDNSYQAVTARFSTAKVALDRRL